MSQNEIKLKRDYSKKYVKPKFEIIKKSNKVEKKKAHKYISHESNFKFKINSKKIKKSIIEVHPNQNLHLNGIKSHRGSVKPR